MNAPTSLRVLAALGVVLLPAGADAQTPAAVAPAATRICLAPAAIEAAPNGVDPMTAVRETFTSFLTGPSLAVTTLEARLASQVREEAKLAGCPFLLLPTIKHKRRTGGGILGKVASGAVQQGAWSVTGSSNSAVERAVAGAAAGAATGAAYDYASGSRIKDELTLSYRLESAGAVLLQKSEKRKATSDGEDLLTPMAQRAAEAIVTATGKSGAAAK